MEPTTRKLEFHKSSQFTGWACTMCGWAQPLACEAESARDLPGNVETDFANHDCAKFPSKSADSTIIHRTSQPQRRVRTSDSA
jgi:hypothetical protein